MYLSRILREGSPSWTVIRKAATATKWPCLRGMGDGPTLERDARTRSKWQSAHDSSATSRG